LKSDRTLDVVVLRDIVELASRGTNLLWMQIRFRSASASTLLSRDPPNGRTLSLAA